MKARVRLIFSTDVDLDTFVPADSADLELVVRAMVGPVDGSGEESFDVTVCTPQRLATRVRDEGPVVGRPLIIDHFDIDEIRDHLTRLIESEEALTWPELGTRIARIGKWEFEDYRD